MDAQLLNRAGDVGAAAAGALLGYGAGLVYFRLLRASVMAWASGQALLRGALLRLLLMGALLALAARAGAPALLGTAAGFWLGRLRVIRLVAAERA